MSDTVSELTINVGTLRDMIGMVGKFVAAKATVPVLSTVRIVYMPDAKRLAMIGTDYDAGMAVAVRCPEPSSPFDLAVNAKMLAEYLGLVSNVGGNVTMRHLKRGAAHRLYMEIGGYKLDTNALHGEVSMLTHVSERFARAGSPLVEPMVADLDPRYWSTIAQIVKSAADDQARPVLDSVCTRVKGGVAELACTDGYRLSFRRNVPMAGLSDGEYLVPAMLLEKAHKMMEGLVEQRLYAGNTSHASTAHQDVVSFVWSGRHELTDMWVDFSARRADGNFPDYQPIVPKNDVIAFGVDAPTVFGALKVANLFARDNAFRVDIGFDGDDAVCLDGLSAETGDAHTKIGVSNILGTAEDRSGFSGITFNGQYLREALEGHDGPMRVGFTQSNRPAIITPVNDRDFAVVVMPMMRGA